MNTLIWLVAASLTLPGQTTSPPIVMQVTLPTEEVVIPPNGVLAISYSVDFGQLPTTGSPTYSVTLMAPDGSQVTGAHELLYTGVDVWRPDEPLLPDTEYQLTVASTPEWMATGDALVELTLRTLGEPAPSLDALDPVVTLGPETRRFPSCVSPQARVEFEPLTNLPNSQLVVFAANTAGVWQGKPIPLVVPVASSEETVCLDVEFISLIDGSTRTVERCQPLVTLIDEQTSPWCGTWVVDNVQLTTQVPLDGPVVMSLHVNNPASMSVPGELQGAIVVRDANGTEVPGTFHKLEELGLVAFVPMDHLLANALYTTEILLPAHELAVPLDADFQKTLAFTTGSATRASLGLPSVAFAPRSLDLFFGCSVSVSVRLGWPDQPPAHTVVLGVRAYGQDEQAARWAWAGAGTMEQVVNFGSFDQAYCVIVSAYVVEDAEQIEVVSCSRHDQLFPPSLDADHCRDQTNPAADAKPNDWEELLGSPNKTNPPVQRNARRSTTGRSGEPAMAAGCAAAGNGGDGVWLMLVLLLALFGRRRM